MVEMMSQAQMNSAWVLNRIFAELVATTEKLEMLHAVKEMLAERGYDKPKKFVPLEEKSLRGTTQRIYGPFLQILTRRPAA